MFFSKRADSTNTTSPPPPLVALTASGDFDGNDGKWSTFFINIGDDASGHGQNFKVLISTFLSATLIPGQSEWCNSDCAEKRGIQTFNGDKPLGLETAASKYWKDQGIYDLPLPHWWTGGDRNSTWGSDSVGLGESSKQSPILLDQFVLPYTFEDFYMGLFGLAIGDIAPGSGGAKSTFLKSLYANHQIPSATFGYTAGAYYRNNGKGTVGDLVLGGYDESRLELNKGATISMPNQKNNTLVVGIQSILYKPDPDVEANTFSFTTESKGFPATIDSTLPYLWLPDSVCDEFADRFQLTYNSTLNLYTVNDTAHQDNKQKNATISFKIGDGVQDSTENYATILLPYDAFDLTIDAPIVDNATNYFPLKKSPNGIYVLGRTFLQEAYIIVDYERANFTVAPAHYSDPMPESNLVSIWNLTYTPPGPSPTPVPKKDSGLAPGAIAGIVVGVVVVLLLSGLGAFFYWKRRRDQKRKLEEKAGASEVDTVVAGNEVKHRRVSELDSEPPGSPKPSMGGFYGGDRDQKDIVPFPPINEMESPPAELYSPPPMSSTTPNSELNGSDYFIAGNNRMRRRGATRESSGNNTPGTPAAVHELPGDDGKYMVGGVHFEPVGSPKTSPVHSRGPSDTSLRTDLDERVLARPDAPADTNRLQTSESGPEAEGTGDTQQPPKAEGDTDATDEGAEGEAGASLERRPSHARGLSDTTDTTAVSQPTPEEREAWARDPSAGAGPRRPLSEQ